MPINHSWSKQWKCFPPSTPPLQLPLQPPSLLIHWGAECILSGRQSEPGSSAGNINTMIRPAQAPLPVCECSINTAQAWTSWLVGPGGKRHGWTERGKEKRTRTQHLSVFSLFLSLFLWGPLRTPLLVGVANVCRLNGVVVAVYLHHHQCQQPLLQL